MGICHQNNEMIYGNNYIEKNNHEKKRPQEINYISMKKIMLEKTVFFHDKISHLPQYEDSQLKPTYF